MIHIELPFPPSSNTAYPDRKYGGGRHLSKKGKEWKEEAMWRIKVAIGSAPIATPFILVIRLWLPDNRERDVDNYVKLPKDALCEILGVKDNWKNVPVTIPQAMGIDRKYPRCEIEICYSYSVSIY